MSTGPNNQDYIGAMAPEDQNNLFNAMSFVVRQLQGQMWTSTIVQVMAVHGGGISAPPTVDVLPLINQIDGQGYATPHGIIYGIPVGRLQGGSRAFVCDPQIGDIGWCNFADKDMSSVLASGAQANPGSRRRFQPSDAVYIATLIGAAPTSYVEIDAAGNVVITTPGGLNTTINTGVAQVNATSVELNSSNIILGGTSGGTKVALVGDAVSGGVITGPGSSTTKAH
jgi:hypothetical protein